MSKTSRGIKILITGVLFGGVAIAGTAFAGSRNGADGHGCRDGLTAEAATRHAQRAADHVLDEVDATDAQRDTIDTILTEAAPRVVALRAEAAPIRTQAAEALSRADRAGLEAARRAALGLLDQGSAEIVNYAAEIAEVLTVEQRETLYALYQDHAAETDRQRSAR